MKRPQKGFTLIELVIVIVIIGILAVIAFPKFINISTNATNASLDGISAAVKSAFSLYYAKNKDYPTVTQLTNAIYVDSGSVTAQSTGVQVTVNGNNYITPTYTDKDCTAATNAVGDTVLCIKSIPHI